MLNENNRMSLTVYGRLIEEARRVGGHKTKKEAVTAALREYVQRRRQLQLLKLFGSIDYSTDYDYKVARQGKRSR